MKEYFETKENRYLISPHGENVRDIVELAWKSRKLREHFFIMSSGTTSNEVINSFALSREAILKNAQTINEHFSISSADRWLSSLPSYHIGGLSIYARAYLSESEVIKTQDDKWNPETFIKTVNKENIQFLSLVPTQLYDLVKLGTYAPSCLRGVFIGGDFASTSLCEASTLLGWPLLITYGMSELSSQIATSKFSDVQSGFLEVLPIHKISEIEGRAIIDSPSLFTEKIEISRNANVRVHTSDNFTLPDKVELKKIGEREYIKPLGRMDDVFKVSGRLFYLNQIIESTASELIKENLFDKIYFSLQADDRLGKKIQVTCIESVKSEEDKVKMILTEKLSISIDAFSFKYTDKIIKTSLGKIKKHQ